MRTFGTPASAELVAQIKKEAVQVFALMPDHRPVTGEALAMDDPDMVVLHAAELKIDGQRFRLSQTVPAARPPFEWLMEISSDLGESEHFKHYLLRDDDIMLALRKDLTPIDAEEAQIILADFAAVRAYLNTNEG